MSNSPKVALITGGAQRIGACIAETLHSDGYTIILHYRNSKDAAEQHAKHLNGIRDNSCHLIQADLTVDEQVDRLAIEAEKIYGYIDVLVNNASGFYPTIIGEADRNDWDFLVNSNAKAAFFLSSHLAPTLKKRQGCIVNIVDVHSEKPLRRHTVYCMAKAALAMMTKSLAKELAPEIRVNGVSPGAILWPEQELPDTKKASILKKIPMQKNGEPSDIARTVAFLASDAPYITGQIIAVDGGRTTSM